MSTRILIIDDDHGLLHALSHWFSQRGYVVETADTAHTGVELCANHTYDVITVDSQMPGMNGEEAIPLIRAYQPGVPILMITGNSLAAESCSEHPPDVLLQKPVGLKELQEHVDLLLQR